MSIGTRLNRRITLLAVGDHLPRRTVRVRLTLLYGALFLLSGAALMAITYALLVNAGFVFTLQNGHGGTSASSGPPAAANVVALAPPSAATMAHWRKVAQCMRKHGLSGFPDPATSAPRNRPDVGELSVRDGAIFAIPATIVQSSAFPTATTACGFEPDVANAIVSDNRHRTETRQQLLLQSGIALAAMSLLSLAVGWLMAGRVLAPLEDAYEAQRQFVANASHELRTPLARQRALIQVALADPHASFSSLRAAHERVLASEQHLEEMIDGLLTLTRGRAGPERHEQLDLRSLTSQALLASEAQLEGLEVRTTLAAAPITGDPRLLERLIANLIDNAIRHNIPDGHVEIRTGTRERQAFVSIVNSGPSVPPDQIQRLFEPFQRLGSARTSHRVGHGLGLSIVQAIATAHRAELDVRARPDGGLAIEISFPVATEAPPIAARQTRGSRNVSRSDAPAES